MDTVESFRAMCEELAKSAPITRSELENSLKGMTNLLHNQRIDIDATNDVVLDLGCEVKGLSERLAVLEQRGPERVYFETQVKGSEPGMVKVPGELFDDIKGYLRFVTGATTRRNHSSHELLKKLEDL